MRFGVNYTPSSGWFHSWLDFSPSSVARDLEQVASLGVDHVRIFPLWPLLQPNRGLIRSSGIADVVCVVDIAASVGLDVNVDALQGHLSSFDFVPAWLESWHRRNVFTEPSVVASTAAYVTTLSAALADRPNLLGVTLGNELNQFAHAPHPAPHPLTAAEASRWLSTMTAAARAGLDGGSDGGARPQVQRAAVTHAMYDAAWYDDAQPFGPEHAADHGDMTVTHSWVFNGSAQTFGALGAGSVRHGEYLAQLAAAWNADPARPNWLQEVGAPTNVVPPADAPDFLETTIRHAAGVQSLYAVTWWCSHDVSRGLLDFPDLEHDLGLFTDDGQLKPTGARFAELVRELAAPAAPAPAPPAHALVLEDVRPSGAPLPRVRASCAPGGAFHRAWLSLAEQLGRGPQVVLRSRSGDPATSARGVLVLHTVPAQDGPAPLPIPHPATTP